MNRSTKILVIGGFIFLSLILFFILTGNKETIVRSRPVFVSSDWEKQYKMTDKSPYGLYLFSILLQSHIGKSQPISSVFSGKGLDTILTDRATLLYIGDEFGLQNEELEKILQKVEGGSTLFLSFDRITENILQSFFEKCEMTYDFSDHALIHFGKTRAIQYYIYQTDTLAYEWKAFNVLESKGAQITELSHLISGRKLPQFIRFQWGNGTVLLQTNPQCFFNYQLKRDQGFAYTSFILEQIPRNRPVQVLELGRLLNEGNGIVEEEQAGQGEGNADDSYFKFLLSNTSFLVAIFLTILGMLLFLVFRSRRMQPVVPIIPEKQNRSLEFVDTITSIYLNKQNPYSLLQVQRKNFYDAVNKHFFIDLGRKGNDRSKDIEMLSMKSNVDVEIITDLLRLLETKVQINVNDQYLIETAKKLRGYYESAGIIHERILQKVNVHAGVIYRETGLSSLFILLGLIVIMTGFYFLSAAVGSGVILWPAGIVLLTIGIQRLSRPLLKFNPNEMVYFPLFGAKKRFEMSDLTSVSHVKGGVLFHFGQKKELLIYYAQMSKFDKAQVERLMDLKTQFEKQ